MHVRHFVLDLVVVFLCFALNEASVVCLWFRKPVSGKSQPVHTIKCVWFLLLSPTVGLNKALFEPADVILVEFCER